MKTTKKRKNYYLPEETINQIKALAEKWNTSENGAIEEAIKAAILTKWRPAKQTTSEKAGALIYGTEPAKRQPEQETPKAEPIAEEDEILTEEEIAVSWGHTFPEDEEGIRKAKAAAAILASQPGGIEKIKKYGPEFLPDTAGKDDQDQQGQRAGKGPAKGTKYRTRQEAAEIRAAKEAAAEMTAKRYYAKEITKAEYKKKLADINKAAAEPNEAGEKPTIGEIRERLARLLKEPKTEQKAKADTKRQKADQAAADENARIDREIEKAKAKAEAGEITADELKAEIERLNDERPF